MEPKRVPALLFPLLEQVSQIGLASPFLSAQWAEARELLAKLRQRGLLTP